MTNPGIKPAMGERILKISRQVSVVVEIPTSQMPAMSYDCERGLGRPTAESLPHGGPSMNECQHSHCGTAPEDLARWTNGAALRGHAQCDIEPGERVTRVGWTGTLGSGRTN